MQSNRHLYAVNIPPFIEQASDRQEREELDDQIEVMEKLVQIYRATIIRIVLDCAVLACGVLVLCALSKGH